MEKRPRQKLLLLPSGSNVENTSCSNKRTIRRDMERQRRQEMANLNASLRSMIPHEYVKGKRSISDHMHEAVNYINHLQIRIQYLSAKRDELKNQYNLNACDSKSRRISHKLSQHCVMVSPCMEEGVEILISGGFKEEGLLLSPVMELLLEEGICVQSCFSTKVNGEFLHTINCKVNDSSGLDLSVLQQKLWNAVTPTS